MAVPYLYRRVDEQIRRRLEERLAQHYPGLKVKVDSAHLVEGEGIEVRGLSLIEPGVEGPRAEILNVESMILSCRYRVQDLVRGSDPEVTRVLVRHPTLHVICRPDGSWNTSPLWPLPRFSDRSPAVKYEDGVVEIVDLTKSPSSTLTLRNVNLTLTPPAADGTRSVPAAGASAEPGPAGRGRTEVRLANPALDTSARQLRGTLASEYFHQVSVEGLVNQDKRPGRWPEPSRGWRSPPSFAGPCPPCFPSGWSSWVPCGDRPRSGSSWATTRRRRRRCGST